METIDLPKPQLRGDISTEEAIAERRSVRRFSSKRLTIDHIAQLLWSCQGVTAQRDYRAAPSAGALYPLEIYALDDGGLFKYFPGEHRLVRKYTRDIRPGLARAALGQDFIESAPFLVVICAVYRRVTSKYGKRGIRYTDIEVGHAAENVHLQAISCGLCSCPIGAFDDNAVSKMLNLPDEEKPVYIIPIGYEGRR